MKRELEIFLTAVMFYTRLPCPGWVRHDPKMFRLSTRYLPLIGWITGCLYAGSVVVFSSAFPAPTSVLLGLSVSILLTGAFHEDGFADVCDGFGGGWSKEKILTIMKDSRVGTYGVVGLTLIFAIRISATIVLLDSVNTRSFVLLIITSHSLSRMMAVTIVYFEPYARADQESKAKPVAGGLSFSGLLIAGVFGIAPCILFVIHTHVIFAVAFIPMAITTYRLARYFRKWIGGYTGDCLGASQQVNEVMFLLTALGLWKLM